MLCVFISHLSGTISLVFISHVLSRVPTCKYGVRSAHLHQLHLIMPQANPPPSIPVIYKEYDRGVFSLCHGLRYSHLPRVADRHLHQANDQRVCHSASMAREEHLVWMGSWIPWDAVGLGWAGLVGSGSG